MKIYALTLSLLLLNTGTFAQTTADETAIKEQLIQTTKDAYALRQAEHNTAMANNVTVFRATNNRTGYQVFAPDALLTSAFGNKPREVNPRLENVTFKFYGPTAAFVTYDQHLYDKPSKEVRMLEKKDGKWKTASSVSLWDYSQNSFEEDAVRKVIETETRAFHEANADLIKSQWSEKAYVERQQENLVAMTGAAFLKGAKLKTMADTYFKSLTPSKHTVKMIDYDVHISGATAWATFTGEELDGAGKIVEKKREVRILEREPGGWKIVFMGFVSTP